MTMGPDGAPAEEPAVLVTRDIVTLKEAAMLCGVKPAYMQVLPSRHGPEARNPFPAPVANGPGRQKLYRLLDIQRWMHTRDMGGRPKSRPPEYLSPGQWLALIKISTGTIRQLPFGDRYWGTHPIGDGVGPVLDQRVVGSLMAEGYVRAVGRRGKNLRYELTADGNAVLDKNPEWTDRTLAEIGGTRAV